MKWTSENLSYPESLKVMKSVKSESERIFSRINQYFDGLALKFTVFAQGQQQQQPINRTRANTVQPKSSSISHDLDNRPSLEKSVTFSELLTNRICAFENAGIRLKEEFSSTITQKSIEYSSKMKEMIDKAEDALNSFEQAKKRRNEAYEKYQQAAETLKSNYNNKGMLPSLKNAFLQAQKDAVDTHTNMNEVAAQTTMKMEGAMSEFEDIERWRSEALKEIISKFINWANKFNQELATENNALEELKNKLPNKDRIMSILNISSIPTPSTEIDYQIFPINPLFSKVIPKKDLYKDEVGKGAKLYRVKQDVKLGGQYVNLVQDEIVAGLEDRGNDIYIRNINECEGLAPKNSLELYD